MRDLNQAKKYFEKHRENTAKMLYKCIDARLDKIRKDVPGVAYMDGMGVSYVYDTNVTRDNKHEDPIYQVYELVFYDKTPTTEEQFGEPLPDLMKREIMLYKKYARTIREIMEISEYLEDEVGYTYG